MIKRLLGSVITLTICLMLSSCLPSSTPFVKFETIPSENNFPDYSLSDSISSVPIAIRDTTYVNSLVRDHRLNEALYYCNSYLLQNPTDSISNYLRFKRFNIQFLQQFMGHYEISPINEFDIVGPHLSLCGKSISKSLNSYLKKENIFPCTSEPDTLFKGVGYPTNKDVWYVINLTKEAKEHLHLFKEDINNHALIAEKSNMFDFLNDFEPEVVSLGVWKFIQNAAWDSASAYCDFMSPKYPNLAPEFTEIKANIAARPKLKEKSIVFAGISSAIIPGTGQFYNKKYTNGLLWLAGIAAQATAATYLLKNANYKTERSEIVFGATLSLTSAMTYVFNIQDAASKTKEFNDSLKKREVELFVNSLKVLPPGVKKGGNKD